MQTNYLQDYTPFWNYRARWLLFYAGPFMAFALVLGTLGVEAGGATVAWWQIPSQGWEVLNTRDFWVPFLWGFWMPWVNGARGPVRGLKRIIFRDFNGNPTLPLAIPLMHGLTWATCCQLPVPEFVFPLLFAAAFLVYDILMLRFDLLRIYAAKFAVPIGPKGILRSALVVWWLYLGIGLLCVHMFGNDSAVGVIAATAILIAPMQALLYRVRRRPFFVKAERVAVIGAGWSGIYAAKWLLEAGLDVHVYERSDHVGGLWKYGEDNPGGVANSTFASSSTYYMHASDFPMDTCYFPKHQEIQKFLDCYADDFHVRERVSLCTEVQSAKKVNGKWHLTVTRAGEEIEDEFDAVVVASGFNRKPQVFHERYANFAGKILHSSEYKHTGNVEAYKRIVVVGLGESAADIAHECAQLRGKEVYCSGSAQWFAGRFIAGDYAADTLMAPGIRTVIAPYLICEIVGRKIVGGLISIFWGRGGSGVPEWVPPGPWLHGFVTKSRAAVEDVHEGTLRPKTRIVKCEGERVEFEDGSFVEADLIIDCTGYAPHFPYLAKDYCFTEQHRLVFNREDPTLSFVGTARPVLGSIPALAEMQSRWIAAVYSGNLPLPSPVEQKYEQFFGRRAHKKRFMTSERRPNLVDHEFYAATIADELGVNVPWLRLFLTRPKQFKMMLLAPWMAFKYNLRGHKRSQALQNIRSYMPKCAFYYGLMKKHFLKMGYLLVLMHLLLLALAIVAVPAYVILLVGCVFLIRSLTRGFRASVESCYPRRQLAAPVPHVAPAKAAPATVR